MIGILNIGIGNIRSVANAVHNLGYDPLIVTEHSQVDDISHLILPGVGSFATAMTHFNDGSWSSAVKHFVDSGRPMLGICLGMQFLADMGEEGGATAGLGLIKGVVKLIPTDTGFPLPHVGWNNVELTAPHPVTERVKSQRDFYFTHSYRFENAHASNLIGSTEYGVSVPAIVARNNVIGMQFHPEKSQDNGLKLIENFCEWDGIC
jgi:imidazole glycerol-phosphate synthase subunit HisH